MVIANDKGKLQISDLLEGLQAKVPSIISALYVPPFKLSFLSVSESGATGYKVIFGNGLCDL
jgi:hypothetical protein